VIVRVDGAVSASVENRFATGAPPAGCLDFHEVRVPSAKFSFAVAPDRRRGSARRGGARIHFRSVLGRSVAGRRRDSQLRPKSLSKVLASVEGLG